MSSYQEQQFSKCNLIFIGGQVIYQCSGTNGWHEDMFFEDLPSPADLSTNSDNTNDIGNYEGLIQSYSGFTLSYNSDIYHAFGGLTCYFKRSLKVNLCHGIPYAYFDWFLLWISLAPQTCCPGTPRWSWSGWIGQSWPNMWNWYNHQISKITNALPQQTWIIWYQCKAHDSKNSYVFILQKTQTLLHYKFLWRVYQTLLPFDCSQTAPTPRKLTKASVYFPWITTTPPQALASFNSGLPLSLSNLKINPGRHHARASKCQYTPSVIYAPPPPRSLTIQTLTS
ncbi:hypothetical protein CPB84DRAFT_1845909 [Gymnopilus junonius]|uniref:Uncharacterized protein n=1 Tax=Gymnopilus junonius TaxID=109634 RepID=A0A9P5NT81_GYMJU|nr:hypothetical protein CPB84DRAFT_1845909 [Gymnopilus junonius]